MKNSNTHPVHLQINSGDIKPNSNKIKKMKLIIDKVFHTFHLKNPNLSFNKKLVAIVIDLSPFPNVYLYYF
ncbi:MAG: hypothetical protein COB15_02650 [Flavobacteriales bacterium]|nr:MAG: hypothetical protein COB15_02650 [Flavobacteriales bacterium]